MKQQKELNDKTRNNRFAAALDVLKRDYDIPTQIELARRMGVNKDTITNILKYRTPVTEDIITKLQTACGCIFNLQWLRGESEIMMEKDVKRTDRSFDVSSWMNAIIAEKDSHNESLKRELDDKDKQIERLCQQVEDLRAHIADLRHALHRQDDIQKDYPFVPGVAEDSQEQIFAK